MMGVFQGEMRSLADLPRGHNGKVFGKQASCTICMRGSSLT